jgi:hypothetical protein
MIFLSKKKQSLKLEVYTPVGQLAELFPVVRSKEALPKWYHHISAPPDQKTVKQCPGISTLFNRSVTIPAWADHDITIYPNGHTEITSPYSQKPTSSHRLSTDAPGAWPGYANIKFLNPWMFWCNKPVDWLFLPPTWNQLDPQEFTVVPGITEFKVVHEANVNTLFKLKDTPYRVSIKAGDALMQMIPITEESFELEIKSMTPQIWAEKFQQWPFSLNYVYHKAISKIKKI